MGKVIDINNKGREQQERKVIRVYEDEVKQIINKRYTAEYENEQLYNLLSEFVYENELEDKFLAHLNDTKAECDKDGINYPLDYDHIALDFDGTRVDDF